MRIVSKIIKRFDTLINGAVRRTRWFNEDVFGDCSKFWSHHEYNLDLINLGSGSAKYGFDYSKTDLKAANWAMMPQTLVGDRVVLANYLSFMKPEKAVVIITLCPFTCLDDGKKYLPDKIYTIADMASIPEFSYERKLKIYDVKMHPIYYFPLMRIFSGIKHFAGKLIKRKMTSKKLEKNAAFWIDSWKKQFSIYNLSDEFSLVNKDRFELSVNAFDNLVSVCINHNFKPVVVLPPVSKYLLKNFDKDFQKKYIYSYLKKSKYNDLLFLNYLGDDEFEDDELYRNANFLNSIGALHFTHRVIEDLKENGLLN